MGVFLNHSLFGFMRQGLLELSNSSMPVEQQIPRIHLSAPPQCQGYGCALPHLTPCVGAGIRSRILTEGRATENRSNWPLYKADALSLVFLPCRLFPQRRWGDQEPDKI